ncbi:She1p Ecym_7442 [Eremothecium cymbalariae DBVPG|uniref:Uncharacterized protein n=1 Tax=Eremothecium cymbalariae (strain CBS 270.75 / DBVPG 7215 / KCTC 17166 / NRRL Y-17582) TaxID=931890 RepID=G8JWP7_ERECY|nr:hypothetical protein Ecym_7442 [Eremothecium cymbalariae DBVPG\
MQEGSQKMSPTELSQQQQQQQQQILQQQNLDEKQQLIDNIGVSRRLGNSVLNELDHRATNLLANLTSSTVSTVSTASTLTDPEQEQDNETQKNHASRFESVHGELIQNMDSIDTHYAVKRNRQGLNVPATPKRYSIQDAMTAVPLTRETDRGELLYNKRARDAMGNIVERLTTSPVTDITRRIRRLRMNMSTPREHHRERERQRRRSSIIRQSLTGGSDKENLLPRKKGFANLYGELRAVSSSAITSSIQGPGGPAFAKPTITSRQKTVNPLLRSQHDAASIFPQIRKKASPLAASSSSSSLSFQHHRQSSPIPTPKQQFTVFTHRSPVTGSSSSSSVPTSSKFRPQLTINTSQHSPISPQPFVTNNDSDKTKPKVVASKSVFDRLYHQPTTATQQKSCTIRKSKTQGDLHYISKQNDQDDGTGNTFATPTSAATATSASGTNSYHHPTGIPRSRSITDLKARPKASPRLCNEQAQAVICRWAVAVDLTEEDRRGDNWADALCIIQGLKKQTYIAAS